MLDLLVLSFSTTLAAGVAARPSDVEATPATAREWTQWRGPERDGSTPGAPWPDDLEALESLWRVPLGRSYSGPVVAAGAVFVTDSTRDAEAVLALDPDSGATLWRTEWEGQGTVPFFARKNGDWIRSTPAYADGALFVGGMEEVVRKLDARTGEELWAVDLPARYATAKPDFGFASSPLIDGRRLIVQGANSVVALDLDSGATVWRALENAGGIMVSGAFSSPVLATIAGVRQIVVQTRVALYGLDPETGTKLWEQPVPNFRGMNILTPLVLGNTVFTSSYRNGSFLFRISHRDGIWSVAQEWTYKASGYMSSPVAVDGSIYLHLGNRRLTCLDAMSGNSCWTSTPFGEYWSLVRRGTKLLALDAGGELLLIAADPEALHLLDRREIAAQPTWGHLAVAGDRIYVRELEGISAYRWPSASQPPAPAASRLSR